MPTLSDLRNLILLPNETLSNEYKSWLDLTTNQGRATLAKAAIALANHGGGVIVMGMVGPAGSPLQSLPRPDGIARYDPDVVNTAVNRYADPKIHCDLHFTLHPETNIEHAIISVPGLSTVPIMSIRDCDGVIHKHRCYLRKPGPKSEEPFTSEEWRTLLSRCVQAGRESMLDSIRIILKGHVPAPIVQNKIDPLREFGRESRERWEVLKNALPTGDPAKIPLGHYEFTFRIVDASPVGLPELKKRLDTASQTKLTGLGPVC
ncbi:AlbA family DNA-binding domain-containing protein [Nitrosospira multiformis]|uniref:DNA-binding domain-containing protein n=1 Tax=Nitrosospira multiformis TaxID=1231 RepID=A0A1I7H8K7_9PROT|nr:hypothetical protein [Nitrosospira multiformis]SFU57041.1 hypothetical protein SAMN05216417_107157 [Nitrosospira multiformis]